LVYAETSFSSRGWLILSFLSSRDLGAHYAIHVDPSATGSRSMAGVTRPAQGAAGAAEAAAGAGTAAPLPPRAACPGPRFPRPAAAWGCCCRESDRRSGRRS